MTQKRTNNDLQNITHKTRDQVTRTQIYVIKKSNKGYQFSTPLL